MLNPYRSLSIIQIICGCFLLPLLLQSCFGNNEKKDIITATISKEKLREDIVLLKNIVRKAHAGAYAYNTAAQVDFLFDSIYNTIETPLTTREFFNKVDYAIDRLRCIHSKTNLPDEYYDSISNKAMFFPIPLVVIGNNIYVNSTAYSIPLGAEVIAVNNLRAKDLIHELGIYYHTDGYSNTVRHSAIDDNFGLNFYLAYGAFKNFTVQYADTVTGKGKLKNVPAEKLKAINDNMYNDTWYFYPGDAPYDFEMLDEKSAAVLTLRSFDYETFATSNAFSHFIENSFRLIYQNEIGNLIIDCRSNGGGYYSSTYTVLSYLVDTPMPEYDSATRRFDKLPYTEYIAAEDTARLITEDTSRKNYTEIRKGIYAENADQVTVWDPATHVFKGRIFVIVNEHVVSAASNFAAILKDKTNAFIIGEETGGANAAHNSAVFTYELPNSHLKVNIPTKRFYQPVPQSNDGRGVIPDKFMSYTVEDVIANSDRPMNYILDSLLPAGKK